MFRTTITAASILAIVSATTFGTAHAQTTNCTPGRVMLLFDRSTSMHDDTIMGVTKWDLATAAVSEIVVAHDTEIEFGLDLFPAAQLSCSGGTVVVNPALNNANDVTSHLTGPIPNMFTPIGQALSSVASVASMNVTNRPNRAVVLITDGHEDCPNASDIESRAVIVAAAAGLKSKGILVYVVGFGAPSNGDGVDALTLNQIAVAGGTAIPGCDPNGASADSPNLCYFQANDAMALTAALTAIAMHVSAETCDGLDNNCDGHIDENLTQSCSTACGAGTQTCSMGHWSSCTATNPMPEVCDGIDNNCDGNIDEGLECACVNGTTQACGVTRGECRAGTQTCTNGAWGTCVGGVGPTTEICDGKDNDCDGVVDPGCGCTMGETRSCGTDKGECKAGSQTCKADGTWGTCSGEVGPTAEVCDGKDNDCDGLVDEEADSENGTTPSLCGDGKTCEMGHCVMNAEDATGRIAGGGLGCSVGTTGGAGGLAGLLVLGLAIAALRRRRSA